MTVRLRRAAPVRGRLVRRYKRFFADVETPDGAILTVHCPNPGSMLGCAPSGAAVRCSISDDPRRKLRHTLEMVRIGRVWVGLHTGRTNAIAAAALAADRVPGFEKYGEIQPEVRIPDGSRLDFRLRGRPGDSRDAYLEVKSVTLAEPPLARFPDSVTERGRRHMEHLGSLAERGARAGLLFVVQRADCERVAPADDIDPAYGAALRAAVRQGVEVAALRVRVTARALEIEGELPVEL